MLRQRVITAVLLLAVLLPALFSADLRFFQLLSLILVLAAGWEWGRLCGLRQVQALAGSGLLLACAGSAWMVGWGALAPLWLWSLGGPLWVALSVWMIRTGATGWGRVPRFLRWIGGLLLLCLAWLAMVQAHRRGVNFLLSVMALVWVADIVAYFSGRALGGRFISRKLAPSISPGKTWEGALGGMLGVVLMGMAWVIWDGAHPQAGAGLHGLLWASSPGLALVSWVFLAAMSVCGDLVESLVKRQAGVKDSSDLLPGHGGVLDRVDALLPVLPLAMMLLAWLE